MTTMMTIQQFMERGWTVTIYPVNGLWVGSAGSVERGVSLALAKPSLEEAASILCEFMQEEEGQDPGPA